MTSLKNKIFETYQEGADLESILLRLLIDQKNKWPELKKNYEQLENRQTRILSGAGASRIVLQFNPSRIGSTLAKVDSKSLRERKCFLCVENLPPEQKGILYRDDYLILCNPYPIFEKHFTISSISHNPQNILGSLPAFLSLVEDIGPAFTVFYNGPQCGASAPDHLHFQACPSGQLPIENEMIENGLPVFRPVLRDEKWDLCVLETTGRGIIFITSENIAAAIASSARAISALRGANSSEPLLNMIARKEKNAFKIMIFPRRKFRPDCFYLEEEKRIAVSPAAVELGGLIITPFKKDFDLLDFAGAVSILKEVSLDSASIIKLLK